MNQSDGRTHRSALALLLLAAAGYACCQPQDCDDCGPPDAPAPKIDPKKPKIDPQPRPRRPIRPWREEDGPPVGGKVSGPSNEGCEIDCDLPGDLHRRNTESRGLGNCVFTSIHHSATWQNVPALQEFPKWLIDKGVPGGGHPRKVDDLIPKMCADRGMAVPDYIQVEGADLEVLKRACKSGRMPGVTYSFSPTGRYGGKRIAHMVSLVSADDKWFVILDNNYPGHDRYEWLTPDEFLRSYAPRDPRTGRPSGWAVILLSPGPPPVPRN